MTRFRDLPGGIDRAGYEWPHVSAIHPEHGVYEMDVHCLRSAEGALVLMAFGGQLVGLTRKNQRMQVDLVRDTARDGGYVVERLQESDISRDVAIRLAAQFHATPESGVVVMQVDRPGEDP